MARLLVGSIHNLAAVAAKADPIDMAAGMEANSRYHDICMETSIRYSYPMKSVVAVFVSLSPNNDYLKNLRSMVTMVAGHRAGMPCERLTVSTYNHCRERAWRFLNGEDFMAVTKGKKIRAFFQCVIDPLHPSAVVVDGHMVSAWCGERMTMKSVAEVKFDYEQIADDIRILAATSGVLPSQMQAIIWFTWKRINAVLYKQTLDLFQDHWQLYRRLDDIKPYPYKRGPISDLGRELT